MSDIMKNLTNLSPDNMGAIMSLLSGKFSFGDYEKLIGNLNSAEMLEQLSNQTKLMAGNKQEFSHKIKTHLQILVQMPSRFKDGDPSNLTDKDIADLAKALSPTAEGHDFSEQSVVECQTTVVGMRKMGPKLFTILQDEKQRTKLMSGNLDEILKLFNQ